MDSVKAFEFTAYALKGGTGRTPVITGVQYPEVYAYNHETRCFCNSTANGLSSSLKQTGVNHRQEDIWRRKGNRRHSLKKGSYPVSGLPFELMLATIPNGEYELTIKKKVKKRTLDQNSLMGCGTSASRTRREHRHKTFTTITARSSFAGRSYTMGKRRSCRPLTSAEHG